MKLYILRHAIAEPRRPKLAENKRQLTEEGRIELQRALAGMKKLKIRPDAILTSPFRRAFDTAVAAAEALTGKSKVIESAALEPDGTPHAIRSALRDYASLGTIMIVGHEPLLTRFSAYLLNSPRLSVKLKKSGLIRIDVADLRGDHPRAELRWLLTPGHLIDIA